MSDPVLHAAVRELIARLRTVEADADLIALCERALAQLEPPRLYDEIRMTAPLVTCASCGKSFYTWPVYASCIRCRQGKA
jgi:hypothetical protein